MRRRANALFAARDEHERQVLIVAQHRRHRHENAAMFRRRLDLHAHEHVAAQHAGSVFGATTRTCTAFVPGSASDAM